MTLPQFRTVQILIFFSAIGLMAMALFFEHVMGLVPCPLCISQRIVVVTIGLIGLAAAIHNPGKTGKQGYSAAMVVIALCGAALAIRQLYLEGMPPELAPACLPGLDYLVEVMPIMDLIAVMVSGTGDCTEVQWTLFGISIPGWTLVCFIGYIALGIFETVRAQQSA